MAPVFLRISVLSGFIAVLLGALGAHPLKTTLAAREATQAWQTASHYQLVHSVACLALAAWAAADSSRGAALQRICILWLIGCLLFSGSIYALALGGPRLLGPVTPLGGLAFLAGWLLLAWEAGRGRKTSKRP